VSPLRDADSTRPVHESVVLFMPYLPAEAAPRSLVTFL
jgi:hypothetical protein